MYRFNLIHPLKINGTINTYLESSDICESSPIHHQTSVVQHEVMYSNSKL